MTLQEFIEKAKARQAEQKQIESEKAKAFLEKLREMRKQQSK